MVENLLEYINNQKNLPQSEDTVKRKKRTQENQINVFTAYAKLNKIEKDYKFIEQGIMDEVRFVENRLALAGFNVNSDKFRNRSILSQERITELNSLVNQFNEKYKGVRSLPNTREITSRFIDEYKQQIYEQYNFDEQGVFGRVAGFTTGLGYGVYHDITKHPFLTASSFMLGGAVGGTLSKTSGILTNKIIQRFAVDGTILGTMGIGSTSDENKIKELLQEDKLNQLTELPKNFVKGGAMGVALAGALKGLTFTGKLAIDGAEKGTFAYKNYFARKKLEDYIETELSNVSADVRSEIFDEITRLNPNSVLSVKDKIISREQLKEYADGLINNNKEKIDNVLKSIGSDFSLANSATVSNLSIDNPLLDNYIKNFDFQTKIPDDISTIENIIKDIPNDLLGELRRSGIENTEGIYRNFPKFAREFISGGEDGVAERVRAVSKPITKFSTSQFPEFTRNAERFITDSKGRDSVFGVREKAIKQLYFSKKPIEKKLSELANGFTFDEIKSLPKNQRNSAKLINKTNKQIEFIETSLSVAKNSDNLATGFFSGNSLPNNLRNALNASLELETDKIKAEMTTFFDEIKNTISRNANSSETSINSLEFDTLYDSVKNTFQGRESTNTIGSKIRDKLFSWDKKLSENGFRNLSETNIGQYLPNAWSPSKISSVNKEFFINQMMELIDKDAMLKLSIANKREITSFSSFLGNMYDRISLNYSARTTSNSLGDLLYTGDRIILFKDGTSFKTANELFGKHSDVGAYLQETFNKYQKKLQLASIGIDNNTEILELNKSLFNAFRDQILLKEGKKETAKISKSLRTLEKQFETMLTDFASGNSSLMPDVNKYLRYTLTLGRKSMLSTAFVTAFFTDQLGSIPLLTKSLGMRNGLLSSFFSSFKGLSNQELKTILGINSTFSKNALATITNDSYLAKTGKALWNFPELAIEKVANLSEMRSKIIFGTTIEQNSAKSFTKLDKPLQDFLKRNGITRKDWDIYRKLPNYDLGYGGKAKLAGHLHNIKPELRNVINKFARAEQTSSILGSPRNTYLGRSYRLRVPSNSFGQIIAYTTQPFISITQTIMHSQYNQVMDFLIQNNTDAFGSVVTQLLISGYVTYYAKALLRGEEPDLTDRDVILQAMMYSGIAGNYVEFMVETLLGLNNYESPSIALIKAIPESIAKGNTKGLYSKIRRGALALNPYKNIALAGQIAQRYTLDQIFKLIDPEGYEKYNKRLVERLDKGELQNWAVRALVPNSYLED